MSTDRSDEQDLAAFGRAVRQLRTQRGMSLVTSPSVSRQPDEPEIAARGTPRDDLLSPIQAIESADVGVLETPRQIALPTARR